MKKYILVFGILLATTASGLQACEDCYRKTYHMTRKNFDWCRCKCRAEKPLSNGKCSRCRHRVDIKYPVRQHMKAEMCNKS